MHSPTPRIRDTQGPTKAVPVQSVLTVRVGPPSQTFAIRVVVSKKIAPTAVQRNLLRRRTREYIRTKTQYGVTRKGVVVFFHKGSADLTRKEFYKELERALKRIA